MPLIAASTGNVTNFSISSGESAGAVVRICTWLGVTSGTASIGSLSHRVDADAHEKRGEDERQRPIPERELEELLQHLSRPPSSDFEQLAP